jgi:hypothetical protein
MIQTLVHVEGLSKTHSQTRLSGVAHDIAHHAASGLSDLSPHMAQVLRMAAIGLQLSNLSIEVLIRLVHRSYNRYVLRCKIFVEELEKFL